MNAFAISFAIYSLVIIVVGLSVGRRAGRSDEEYWLGGRSLGPWVAALSSSASSESGWVTLGLVGAAFLSGASMFWVIPGIIAGYLVNWFLLANRMRDDSRSIGALTIPDLLSLHFKERLPVIRLVAIVVVLVGMWLYVAAQFAIAGKAFNSAFDSLDGFIGLSGYQNGVLMGAAIVLVYTVVGGFRSASVTDAIQAFMMFLTLAIFPAWLLVEVGGFGFMREQLATVTDGNLLRFWPELTGGALLGFLIGGNAIGIGFGFPGQPHILVRFMAIREKRHIIPGAIIALVWVCFTYTGAILLGLLVRALAASGEEWAIQVGASDGETALIEAAQAFLPGALAGIVLAGILSAVSSTADSQLVVAASAIANDFLSRILGLRGGAGALMNRLAVLVLGLGAIALVFDEEVRVFTFVLDYGWAILGAGFGPQVLLAMLWRRASWAGCVAGIVTGFIVALGWKMFTDQMIGGVQIYNLTLGFACALVVNVLVSLLLPDRRTE